MALLILGTIFIYCMPFKLMPQQPSDFCIRIAFDGNYPEVQWSRLQTHRWWAQVSSFHWELKILLPYDGHKEQHLVYHMTMFNSPCWTLESSMAQTPSPTGLNWAIQAHDLLSLCSSRQMRIPVTLFRCLQDQRGREISSKGQAINVSGSQWAHSPLFIQFSWPFIATKQLKIMQNTWVCRLHEIKLYLQNRHTHWP